MKKVECLPFGGLNSSLKINFNENFLLCYTMFKESAIQAWVPIMVFFFLLIILTGLFFERITTVNLRQIFI